MPVLFLMFVIVPIIEITVLIQVGSAIGVLPTVAIVVITAILGSAMLRHQGLATLAKAQQRMDKGEMPAHELIEGLLLVVGGVLLLTPGFVTDTMGFLCLIPFPRHLIASRLGRGALMQFRVAGGAPSGGFGSRVRRPTQRPRTVGTGASAAATAQGSAANDGPEHLGGVPAGESPSAADGGATGDAVNPHSGADKNTIDGDFSRLD